jgi:hypothetical protein
VWLADENFDNDILRGLRRRDPRFDAVRVQDILDSVGRMIRQSSNGRVLMSESFRPTMFLPDPRCFYAGTRDPPNLRTSAHNSPVVFVPKSTPIGCAIHDIGLLDRASVEADWIAGVIYLPLG